MATAEVPRRRKSLPHLLCYHSGRGTSLEENSGTFQLLLGRKGHWSKRTPAAWETKAEWLKFKARKTLSRKEGRERKGGKERGRKGEGKGDGGRGGRERLLGFSLQHIKIVTDQWAAFCLAHTPSFS
jgi:hypothetical protein